MITARLMPDNGCKANIQVFSKTPRRNASYIVGSGTVSHREASLQVSGDTVTLIGNMDDGTTVMESWTFDEECRVIDYSYTSM